MSKRRDLKKDVDYLCDEIRLESFGCLLQPEINEVKYAELLERIEQLNVEFRNRSQGASLKADSRSAKQYYKQLREDFNAEAELIYAELKSLIIEKSEN